MKSRSRSAASSKASGFLSFPRQFSRPSPLSSHQSEVPRYHLGTYTDSFESLYLKSGVPNDDARQQGSNAVLCTDSQTYHIRQVHSSNSIFVTLPWETPHNRSEETIVATSISAVAKCTATLELLPSSPCSVAYLRERLASYVAGDQADSEVVSSGERNIAIEGNKSSLLEDAPFSVREFESAWKILCAFDLEGKSFRPTAPSLVSIWRSILSAISLRSINLEESFSLDALVETADEDGHPLSLLKAVLARLAQQGVGAMDKCTSNWQQNLTILITFCRCRIR